MGVPEAAGADPNTDCFPEGVAGVFTDCFSEAIAGVFPAADVACNDGDSPGGTLKEAGFETGRVSAAEFAFGPGVTATDAIVERTSTLSLVGRGVTGAVDDGRASVSMACFCSVDMV